MKILKKRLVTYLVLAFPFTGYMMHRALYSFDQPFSLDRVYPETWYTKAQEHCTQAWAFIEEMLQKEKNTNVSFNYLLDASIGQLSFAKNCIQHLVKNEILIMHDDLLYLSRIIGTIDERCVQLSLSITLDKMSYLMHVVAKLRKQVELLLQADNTRTNASH